LLHYGDAIAMNKSLAVHYLKWSSDQGDALARSYSGHMLNHSRGIVKNKALAAHYYNLSADQSDAHAQLNRGHCFVMAMEL
jgi:TPR repeat protein